MVSPKPAGIPRYRAAIQLDEPTRLSTDRRTPDRGTLLSAKPGAGSVSIRLHSDANRRRSCDQRGPKGRRNRESRTPFGITRGRTYRTGDTGLLWPFPDRRPIEQSRLRLFVRLVTLVPQFRPSILSSLGGFRSRCDLHYRGIAPAFGPRSSTETVDRPVCWRRSPKSRVWTVHDVGRSHGDPGTGRRSEVLITLESGDAGSARANSRILRSIE